MDLTIRQVQRLLHKSRTNPNTLVAEGVRDIAQLANHLVGLNIVAVGAVHNGHLWMSVASNFAPRGTRAMYAYLDPHHAVDRLCRKYGPNASVKDIIKQEQPAKQPPQPPKPESGEGSDADADGHEDADAETQAEPSTSAKDMAKAREAAEDWRADEAARQRQAEAEAQAAAARKKLADNLAAAKAKALAEAKKAAQNAKRQPSGYRRCGAKQALKKARQAVSFSQAAEASGPSLASRHALSSANGRLRAVPAALRSQMAELLNRLVGNTGNTGGNVGPIPVYDSRRLVKRLLVKRPLPNALKEDVISGRPVTLILPDVSPPCAKQAQAACDIANAAGYAGVSGSDVLVLPHSNGCIEEHVDAYMPWFNGRPVDVRGTALRTLFRTIITGKSSYKLRVVIAVGDHDAVDMYEQLAGLRQVTRLIWLHNASGRHGGLRNRVVTSTPEDCPGWVPDSLKKLSLIWGCHSQRRMLKGLALSLR
jgi:hypothetical protein